MTYNYEQKKKRLVTFYPHCKILFVVDAIMCFVLGVKKDLVPSLIKIDF